MNGTDHSDTGKTMVGQTLTANNGSWSGNPTTYTYQWQRCSRDGTGCGNVANRTTKTYTLAEADVGNSVQVIVTARNSDGSSSASSKPSDVTSGNAAPRVREKPSVTGKPAVGETLTANPGEWAEGPAFTYQWQLCDKAGSNCKDIGGSTGKTYGVRSSDKDSTIRIEVTAKNLVDTTTAMSDVTAAVAGTTAPVGVGGALTISAVSLPNRLVISQVQFSPRVITSRTQPVTARVKISEVNAGRGVSGALVYAIGVPSNLLSNPGEVQTDSTGWATITFRPLRGLPFRSGARVNVFVRARKAGENPLAGVSTRRLISVGVRPSR